MIGSKIIYLESMMTGGVYFFNKWASGKRHHFFVNIIRF